VDIHGHLFCFSFVMYAAKDLFVSSGMSLAEKEKIG
jgi:hypothetical protein